MNEVGSGLTIQDSLQGVPVNVSASLIMNLVGIYVGVEDMLTFTQTVVRLRIEQLLSRCARLVRIHCRIQSRRHWSCLVEST